MFSYSFQSMSRSWDVTAINNLTGLLWKSKLVFCVTFVLTLSVEQLIDPHASQLVSKWCFRNCLKEAIRDIREGETGKKSILKDYKCVVGTLKSSQGQVFGLGVNTLVGNTSYLSAWYQLLAPLSFFFFSRFLLMYTLRNSKWLGLYHSLGKYGLKLFG